MRLTDRGKTVVMVIGLVAFFALWGIAGHVEKYGFSLT
jgi:hypothetical protein